jgi:predicted ATPase
MTRRTRKAQTTSPPTPTRIEAVTVKNYRALRSIKLNNLTPLTVLLGPNGSGKSTVFDVFSFLAECFGAGGLRAAWEKRGRFRELRTRGADGPIVFELTYREAQAGSVARASKPTQGASGVVAQRPSHRRHRRCRRR